MNKDQKNEVIGVLKEKFSQYDNFYITNTESLTVAQVTKLRGVCFDKQVELKVAKNTLIKKALESLDSTKYAGVFEALNNVTALMFSENPKEPALILSSFRTSTKGDKPVLKAAFINGDVYVGDNQLVNLTKIKTKNELIGEVIGLLLSPAQRVIAALLNGKGEGVAETETPAAEAAPAPVAEAPVAEAQAPVAEAPTPAAIVETKAPEAAAPAAAPAAEVTPPAAADDAKTPA
jgi:large subunit ribosomal protein L10